MTKPPHTCPQCGRPDCSPPDPSTLGVPNWLWSLLVIVGFAVALLGYTAAQR
ncbi:hypothetical protein ACFYYR_07300 [Streptomyces sp. NPDC001922]|uniref:hypothetical protein n=1 Tax=unclassified Streptomyces TaxID=2593676 RepID=UPI003329F36E